MGHLVLKTGFARSVYNLHVHEKISLAFKYSLRLNFEKGYSLSPNSKVMNNARRIGPLSHRFQIPLPHLYSINLHWVGLLEFSVN